MISSWYQPDSVLYRELHGPISVEAGIPASEQGCQSVREDGCHPPRFSLIVALLPHHHLAAAMRHACTRFPHHTHTTPTPTKKCPFAKYLIGLKEATARLRLHRARRVAKELILAHRRSVAESRCQVHGTSPMMLHSFAIPSTVGSVVAQHTKFPVSSLVIDRLAGCLFQYPPLSRCNGNQLLYPTWKEAYPSDPG